MYAIDCAEIGEATAYVKEESQILLDYVGILIRLGKEMLIRGTRVTRGIPSAAEPEGELEVEIKKDSRWRTELPAFLAYHTRNNRAVKLFYAQEPAH